MHGVAWRGTEVNVRRRVCGFYLGSETPRRGSRDSFRLETRAWWGTPIASVPPAYEVRAVTRISSYVAAKHSKSSAAQESGCDPDGPSPVPPANGMRVQT